MTDFAILFVVGSTASEASPCVTDINISNETEESSNLDHAENSAHAESKTIIFLFATIALGAFLRWSFKNTRVPYTVSLMLVGLGIGFLSNNSPSLQEYTSMARMDPHLILYIFMPTLIFESAFVMSVHIFKKMTPQILLLAGPGMLFTAVLTAWMCKMLFTYGWSWWVSLMFGAVMSATDPVAVVALLKDIGASDRLGTLMEGESLFNDGTAIVLFNVMLALSKGESYTEADIILMFIRVAIGGPLFGWLCGKVMVWCLASVFNDVLVEVTITIASSYIAFYLAEAVLGVSGVLAVVVLGLHANQYRAHISPEVEEFLHHYWEMMVYLANTTIFVLVGVVIGERAFDHVDASDWFYLMTLYFGATAIRGISFTVLSPLLGRLGYGISWQLSVVMTWGGLRGAVGLALAMVVEHDADIDTMIGSKILFHTAGIVVLTLLINATTIRQLLQTLKFSDVSPSRLREMKKIVDKLDATRLRLINDQKTDKFLSDAIWTKVTEYSCISNPYSPRKPTENQKNHKVTPVPALFDELIQMHTEDVGDLPTTLRPHELRELSEHSRVRYLKAEKCSYWRQYEIGMLGRDSVRMLNAAADQAIDTTNKLVDATEIAPLLALPTYVKKLERQLAFYAWIASGTVAPKLPNAKHSIVNKLQVITSHSMFDKCISVVVLINVIAVLWAITEDYDGQSIFDVINYICTAIYTIEAIVKLIAMQKQYFRSRWNLFDSVILLFSYIDIIVSVSTPNGSDSGFSPNIVRMVRIFKVLRTFRALRLIRAAVPLMKWGVTRIISYHVAIGFDIGKAYVIAREEVDNVAGHVISHDGIANMLRAKSDESRTIVVQMMADLQKEFPDITVAVKTRQASRCILNGLRQEVRELQEDGVMDERDVNLLKVATETQMKMLLSSPPSLKPPDPYDLLFGVTWLDGASEEVMNSIKTCANLRSFEIGEVLGKAGDPSTCMYLVVSGLVRITFTVDGVERSHMLGAGQVIGELGTVTNEPRSADMACETAVQTFVLDQHDLMKAMKDHSQLSEKLWRVCGIRAAVTALAALPLYTKWSTQRLKKLCEQGELVPMSPPRIWNIDERVCEAMVLKGTATCTTTGRTFCDLTTIPRGVNAVDLDSDTQFLIIPANDDICVRDLRQHDLKAIADTVTATCSICY